MPPVGPSRDDFDMAKLQKSLKQRQRHSVQARPHVARLTPAEVRALNHGAASSKISSSLPSKRTSEPLDPRLSSRSPPTTPDALTAYETQLTRAATSALPTPPHSPGSQHRRASQPAANDHRRPSQHHHGQIHHPRPHASKQADFMIANGLRSRPSSVSSTSSNRSLPMYRGHEITRTGSLTMLQRPAHEIVANPLSMFSRPRQATVNTAPDPRREFPDMDPYQAEVMLNAEENQSKFPDAERHPSPVQHTESPVSIEQGKHHEAEQDLPNGAEQSTELPFHGRPNPTGDKEAESSTPNTDHIHSQSPSGPIESEKEVASKKTTMKRFSFHAGFMDKKDKDFSGSMKKLRRRTVSFTKSTEEASEHHHRNPKSGKEDPSPESSDDEIHAHPAVRPPSLNLTRERSSSNSASFVSTTSATDSTHGAATDSRKSLTPLVVPKGPVYGRCACCGKIKRPNTFAAELSPVLENENIRANFTIEAERHRTKHHTASLHSQSSRGYTPIIPMAVQDEGEEGREGSIRTVQASIEPMPEELQVRPPTMKNSEPQKKRNSEPPKKRNSEPPRFVRFASLHGRKAEDEAVDPGTEDEEIEVVSTPVVDPTIKPRTNVTLRPASIASDSRESVETLDTVMSISMARPMSMTTVRPQTETALRRMSMPAMSTKAPSESSGMTSATGARSSVIEQWYEKAIQNGPKQDVITVVGWDEKGKKVESQPVSMDYVGDPAHAPPVKAKKSNAVQPAANGHAVEPANASPLKETSPYEAKTAMEPPSLIRPPSPIKETSKENKRKSFLPGGLFKKLVTTSSSKLSADDSKTPTSASPISNPAMGSSQNNDSAISMSGAIPSLFSSFHRQATTDGPEQSKFAQYSPLETKKGHSPKLSLGLGSDDMSLNLGLPTPQMGPHFARSNTTLRHLVLAQQHTPPEGTPKDLEMITPGNGESSRVTEVQA